jgi:polygalacturonase
MNLKTSILTIFTLVFLPNLLLIKDLCAQEVVLENNKNASARTWQENKHLRKAVPFDQNWKFKLGNIKDAESITFDDKNWANISIPHSWNRPKGFDEQNPKEKSADFFEKSVGWYRKIFKIDALENTTNYFRLNFLGVNHQAEVWLNGKYLGKHAGRDTDFHFGLNEYLFFDKENILAVKVDNQFNPKQDDAQVGIYREVIFQIWNPFFVKDIQVNPLKVSINSADIEVVTTFNNKTKTNQKIKLLTHLLNPQNEIVLSQSLEALLPAGTKPTVNQLFTNFQPLQSTKPENPIFYRIVSMIYDERGKLVDEKSEKLVLKTNDWDLKTALEQEKAGWASVPKILEKIKSPIFANKILNIKDFGGIADGKTDAKQAFERAIKTCHQGGGGKVLVPAGDYLVNGTITMLSNVNLHLEKGATIRFGTNPQDYLPVVKVRWEGTICYNYSPLIYAYQQENVAVTGEGTLDGQTEGWWSLWKKDNDGKNQDNDKKVLRQMGNDLLDENQRVFGENHYLRPSLIEFYECKNILLEDFTAKSSPFWTIHPVFSKNITIRNLTIRKGTTNDDGIDPDSCEDVLIENCDIDTDDDPIAIKAGRDNDAWDRQGTRNVVIKNCKFKSNVGNAFCIGSEMSGGVQNIFVENCQVSSTPNGINFKCNLDRGGSIKNVFVRNITFEHCKNVGVLFQMDYHSYRGGNFPPDFQQFYLSNLQFKTVEKIGIKISGVESKHIQNVLLSSIKVEKTPIQQEIKFTDNLLWTNVK